jgi:hypothetical protein
MPRSSWTPSIPKDDQNIYLVVDDLGRNGQVYREIDVETTIWKPLSPTCSTASIKTRSGSSVFNTAEKWSKDVSADVAHEHTSSLCEEHLAGLGKALTLVPAMNGSQHNRNEALTWLESRLRSGKPR